jgi:nitrate/TMAO reductase-like tetraheme cytochrome c subunit/mono/diheme cytochrome c family protein
LLSRIRRLIFPPRDSSLARRLIPLVIVLAIPLIILLVIPATWQYSNSPEFCGETCHTMPPEYNTYLVSPHARVLCVDCHIGRGSIYEQFIRKAGHSKLIFDTLTDNYEFPIFVDTMRPARETCEMCHFPEKFSDDSLRAIHRFEDNEENDPYIIYLLMHTGGGTAREGLGRGIHWHIENTVEFVATDEHEQDIPWVRVTFNDGKTVEYTIEDSPVTADNVDDYDIQEMDCITCHNRISHMIPPPQSLVDNALSRGDISSSIPFIREQGVDLLAADYETSAEASEASLSLEDFYQDAYPEYYAENAEQIENAARLLEQLYAENNYPEQELDWMTHSNNIGHRDWPGCFRCHDGNHFSTEGEAVRLECNLCHSIPQIVYPGEIEPMLPLTTGIEPASHKETTWISRHHNELDTSCANCHTVSNPGGTSDTSFCSNSGCHGVDWRYANLDAPTLALNLGIEQEPAEPAPLLKDQPAQSVTYQDLQPLFEQQCAACHGDTPTKGLRVTDYDSLLAGSETGPVIVPGEPGESLLLDVLASGHFGNFTETQLGLVEQWIADGAPQGAAAEEPPAEEVATQIGRASCRERV